MSINAQLSARRNAILDTGEVTYKKTAAKKGGCESQKLFINSTE